MFHFYKSILTSHIPLFIAIGSHSNFWYCFIMSIPHLTPTLFISFSIFSSVNSSGARC